MLDQIKDVNEAGLYQLFNVWDFPEFVKTASHSGPEDVRTMNPGMFAWPAERMFPVHTAADTWLSAAYFHKFATDLPDHAKPVIQDALNVAAGFWDIQLPAAEQMAKTAAPTPTARFSVDYAFRGEVRHRASGNTAEELCKVAADVLTPGKYPYEMRKTAARQVLAADDELLERMPGDLFTDLHKTAGYGTGMIDSARAAVHQRLLNVQDNWEHLATGLTEMDDLLVKSASAEGLLSMEMLDKAAGLLDAVDQFTGAHNRYGGTFQPAEKQLFGITTLDFEQFGKEAVKLTDGQYVSRKELRAAKATAFLNNFGYKVASEEDLLNIIPELPSRRSSLLYTHVKQAAQATA